MSTDKIQFANRNRAKYMVPDIQVHLLDDTADLLAESVTSSMAGGLEGPKSTGTGSNQESAGAKRFTYNVWAE